MGSLECKHLLLAQECQVFAVYKPKTHHYLIRVMIIVVMNVTLMVMIVLMVMIIIILIMMKMMPEMMTVVSLRL